MKTEKTTQVLVDRTVQRLERMIVDGTLASGHKLSEQALSEQLGVSRGPLREAIRTLEGRRIVERTPHSGARVRVLTLDDIEQILITREALEAMACRQAAENMSLREINDLRRCLDTLEASRPANGGAPDVRLVLLGVQDTDFHVQLARGSRNRWLAELLCRDLYALLCIVRFKAASVGGRIRNAVDEHYAILDRIERRDPEGAEQLMRKHISAGRISLLAQIRDDPSFINYTGNPISSTSFRTFGSDSLG